MSLNLDNYQKLLEEEKNKLEGELGEIAHRNPDAPADWQTSYPEQSVNSPAPDEKADQDEEFANTSGQESALEERLLDINDALDRIKHGTFGICAVGKEEMGEDRLQANPAARTCIKHASE